jgi:hypothetical protein
MIGVAPGGHDPAAVDRDDQTACGGTDAAVGQSFVGHCGDQRARTAGGCVRPFRMAAIAAKIAR